MEAPGLKALGGHPGVRHRLDASRSANEPQ